MLWYKTQVSLSKMNANEIKKPRSPEEQTKLKLGTFLEFIVSDLALKCGFGIHAPKWTVNYISTSAFLEFNLKRVFVYIHISSEWDKQDKRFVVMQMLLDTKNSANICNLGARDAWRGVDKKVEIPVSSLNESGPWKSVATHLRLMQKTAYIMDVLCSMPDVIVYAKCRPHTEDCLRLEMHVRRYANIFSKWIVLDTVVSPNGCELLHVNTISRWETKNVNKDYSTIGDLAEETPCQWVSSGA